MEGGRPEAAVLAVSGEAIPEEAEVTGEFTRLLSYQSWPRRMRPRWRQPHPCRLAYLRRTTFLAASVLTGLAATLAVGLAAALVAGLAGDRATVLTAVFSADFAVAFSAAFAVALTVAFAVDFRAASAAR